LVHKEKLLQFVLDIKANIEKEMEGVVKEPLAWTKQMGEWLYDMRMEGVKFTLQGRQYNRRCGHHNRDFL
jgi:hypothetical protein